MALLLTLRDGGARLASTGNLNATLPEAVEALRAEGITVIGGPTKDSEVHASYLDEVLPAKPDLILDNDGDLFARYLDRPYEALLGGTEETTSGRMRLEPLRGSSSTILVINDSPIKQFVENEHGSSLSWRARPAARTWCGRAGLLTGGPGRPAVCQPAGRLPAPGRRSPGLRR